MTLENDLLESLGQHGHQIAAVEAVYREEDAPADTTTWSFLTPDLANELVIRLSDVVHVGAVELSAALVIERVMVWLRSRHEEPLVREIKTITIHGPDGKSILSHVAVDARASKRRRGSHRR